MSNPGGEAVSGKYDDIIDLPHPVSGKHPQMPLLDRAAQFSPFAALTGHEDAIEETARLTDRRIELDEESKEILNRQLQMILEKIEEHPMLTITYFVPDTRKNGGAYVDVTGSVKKLNLYEHQLIMMDGTKIPLDEIIEIKYEVG